MKETLRRIEEIAEAPFETGIISKVEGCSMEFNDSCTWLGFPEECKDWVKPGMPYALWGKGFGYQVRGIAIDGYVCRYETEAEHEVSRKAESDRADAERKAKFLEGEPEYRSRIAALPEVFQDRFLKFQKANPDFDWEYGGYELFTCEQALAFADALKTTEALDEFRKLDYADQKKRVPAMEDGHSGNTFGMACRLAHHYLTDQELVYMDHGALTALVGCDDFGCPHPAPDRASLRTA